MAAASNDGRHRLDHGTGLLLPCVVFKLERVFVDGTRFNQPLDAWPRVAHNGSCCAGLPVIFHRPIRNHPLVETSGPNTQNSPK